MITTLSWYDSCRNEYHTRVLTLQQDVTDNIRRPSVLDISCYLSTIAWWITYRCFIESFIIWLLGTDALTYHLNLPVITEILARKLTRKTTQAQSKANLLLRTLTVYSCYFINTWNAFRSFECKCKVSLWCIFWWWGWLCFFHRTNVHLLLSLLLSSLSSYMMSRCLQIGSVIIQSNGVLTDWIFRSFKLNLWFDTSKIPESTPKEWR